MNSFAGESQARNRYTYFAGVAKKAGYEQIAAIFTETAEQKKSHTKTLFRFLEGCALESTVTFKAEPLATTAGNLRTAIEAETHQCEILYAEFEETARNEGFKQIATKLMLFRQIKKFYADRFSRLASNLKNGSVFNRDKKVKWVCRKCGLIYENERALKICPGCDHPQAYFEILAENY